ncbi:unnamed protein product [Lampetra planeri]
MEHAEEIHGAVEELECRICYLIYHPRTRTAKLLRCGHTFCKTCLIKLSSHAYTQGLISCPYCRQVTVLKKGGPLALPINKGVMENLAAHMLKKKDVKTQRSEVVTSMDHVGFTGLRNASLQPIYSISGTVPWTIASATSAAGDSSGMQDHNAYVIPIELVLSRQQSIHQRCSLLIVCFSFIFGMPLCMVILFILCG